MKGKAIYKETKEGQRLKARKCEFVGGNEVDGSTEACDHFEPVDYFVCHNNDVRMKAIVCKARRDKGQENCDGCTQKYEIDRAYNLMENAGRPRSLPKRTDEPAPEPRPLMRKVKLPEHLRPNQKAKFKSDPKPSRKLIRRRVREES
jgi:hypothetical protein